MVHRHVIAWVMSGTSVVASVGVTAMTAMAPTPPAPAPRQVEAPPVTVYEDRYVDQYVVAAAVPETPAVAPTTATAVTPEELAALAAAAVASTDGTVAPGEVAAGAAPTLATVPAAASLVAGTNTSTRAPSPAAPPRSGPAVAPNTPSPAAAPAAPANHPASPTTPTTTPRTTVPRPGNVPTTTIGQFTLPPGAEVPDDWPAGVPYPPIPPGCREPELEDDGRWECDD